MPATSVHHLHSSPDRKSEAQDVCKEIYQPFLTSLPLDFVCGELELVWMRCHIQRTRGYWYRDFKLPSCFDDHVHVYHDHDLSLVSPLSSWLLLHCHHIHDIFFIVIFQVATTSCLFPFEQWSNSCDIPLHWLLDRDPNYWFIRLPVKLGSNYNPLYNPTTQGSRSVVSFRHPNWRIRCEWPGW